eukprot:m.5057 g.5057  ORF g.5057 m.5057 type:complete len:67 (+) comp2478_c1_seq1:34-234(+)
MSGVLDAIELTPNLEGTARTQEAGEVDGNKWHQANNEAKRQHRARTIATYTDTTFHSRASATSAFS